MNDRDERGHRADRASQDIWPAGLMTRLQIGSAISDQPTQRLDAADLSNAAREAPSPAAPGDTSVRAIDLEETLILHDLLFPGPRPFQGLEEDLAPYSGALPTMHTAGRAKLTRNTLVAVLSRFITYGISLPLSIVMARLLGPEGRGTYAIFLLIVLLFVYCSLGVSSAGIYFVGKKLHPLREVVGTLLGLGLALSAFVTAIYLLLALVFTTPIVSELPLSMRLLVGVLGPLTLIAFYFSDCLLAAQDIVSYNIANIVQAVCQAVGFILFFLLYDKALTAAAASYALAVIISFVVVVALLWKHTPIRPLWRPGLVREMLGFGLKSYLASILNLGNLRLDVAFVTLFVGVAAVGQYSVATSLSELTWQLPLVMSTVLFPTAAAASSISGAKIIARACRRLLLVLVVVLLALFAVAPALINVLYGASYLPAVTALVLLLPGAVGFTVYKTLYSYLMGNGRPAVGIVSTFASLAVTVVLDVLLIPRYGIAGAAITSSVAYCVNGGIVLIAFVAIARVNPIETLIATPQDVADIFERLNQQTQKLRVRVRRLTSRWTGRSAENAEVSSWVVVAHGVILGLWLGGLLLGLDLTLALLAAFGLFAILGLTQRVWLVVAILVTDLTLTDYLLPLPGSPSLRVALGGLLVLVLLFSLAQGSMAITRESVWMTALVVGLVGVALLSNLVNGGSNAFISHTAVGVVVMLYLATLIQRTRDLILLVCSLTFIALLSAFTGIVQALLRAPITVGDPDNIRAYAGRAFGLTQNPINLANGLAVVAAPLAAMLLYVRLPWRIRIAGWSAVAVLVAGVYLSGSRSGLLALCGVALVLALGLRPRARVIVIVLLLIMTVAVATRVTSGGSSSSSAIASRSSRETELSSSQRLALWEAGAFIVRDNPILGIGYDRFPDVSPRYRDQISPQLRSQPHVVEGLGVFAPHDDFLNMLISFGPLGLLLFLGLHIFGARSAWMTWRRAYNPWLRALALGALAALAAYCAHALVHNAFADSLHLWAILGIILATQRLQAAEPQNTLAGASPVAVEKRQYARAS